MLLSHFSSLGLLQSRFPQKISEKGGPDKNEEEVSGGVRVKSAERENKTETLSMDMEQEPVSIEVPQLHQEEMVLPREMLPTFNTKSSKYLNAHPSERKTAEFFLQPQIKSSVANTNNYRVKADSDQSEYFNLEPVLASNNRASRRNLHNDITMGQFTNSSS